MSLKLSGEEVSILKQLNDKQLAYLSKLSNEKDFYVFKQIINVLINIERDYFFGSNTVDPQKLYDTHNFSRGGIAKLVTLGHLIGGAVVELERRHIKSHE